MPIRKAGPRPDCVFSSQSKQKHMLVKTSHALSSLLGTSEDEHAESA